MKKLIKEYQDSYEELKDKLDNSLLLKFNNITRKFNTFGNRNTSISDLIKNIEHILTDLTLIKELIEQEENNDMISIMKDLEIIKEKLIKIKFYNKYKEIKSKFEPKPYHYSGIPDLKTYTKLFEENINFFGQYEFPEDNEIEEFMNNKEKDLKELFQEVNNIQILYDNLCIEKKAKKYLTDSEKYLKESNTIENHINTFKEKIDSIIEENKNYQTEIEKLNDDIEEIKKECPISENEKIEYESKIKALEDQKMEKGKKDKEKENKKEEVNQKIALLQSQIDEMKEKLNLLLESENQSAQEEIWDESEEIKNQRKKLKKKYMNI